MSLNKFLLKWFRENKRNLPWRLERNPYKIWISEVMLQQTQVSTVIPYYLRFLERFPTIDALANAPINDLMKLWEGLGYYSRAKNLKLAAQAIIEKYGGNLPQSKNELLNLKGFGDYTSGSVASIAFGERCTAIDGNVLRVISRLFEIRTDITKPETKHQIEKIVYDLLPARNPGEFNEALMEFGALICTPKKPNCIGCPLRVYCKAYESASVGELPFKPKKPKIPHKEIAVAVVKKGEKVLIAKRPEGGLLPNLWEFPGGKIEPNETAEACCQRELLEETGLTIEVQDKITSVKHSYTHFKITLHAFWATVIKGTARAKASQEIRWVKLTELNLFAFPKANQEVLKKILDQKG
ncbi:MAG: A/G-specific adenine glycosylase [Chloroherpetonaceae bacterium]|nr:A/G-specific adenine glycosylase [Chloroherpetonaceae bacterium]